MQYRHHGKLPALSLLGFGGMRFPRRLDMLDERGFSYLTDEDEAISQIRYAIDNGVNLIETARAYGDSEEVIGKALKDGYREKVYVATKSPFGKNSTAEEWDDYLNKSLDLLGVDCIEFYMQHGLNADSFANFVKQGIYERAMEERRKGRIKYFGFSFHDEHDVFMRIIDAYEWDFCQIQYNYVDTEFQAGMKGLKAAGARGMGVFIMEPLRGGRIVAYQPEDIMDEVRANGINRTPAELAFRWVANHPEVTCVVSGMNTMEMLIENLATFSSPDLTPGGVPANEITLVERLAERWKTYNAIGCTGCNYCLPCPAGVDIPGTLTCLNLARSVHHDSWGARKDYRKIVERGAGADLCTSCGVCEPKCPQKLQIISTIEEAHKTLIAFKWDIP